jgi:octaprenyl-diphosphate synthase
VSPWEKDETLNSADLGHFLLKMKDYQHRIDDALTAELDQHRDSSFHDPIVQALKGGKRLRPLLLILSYEAVGGKGADPFPAAVAVELAHTESLIHDDIIDRDLLRREKPSFHAVYDYEMALLSADFILSLILDITARYKGPRIARALADATSRMSEGQIEEIKVYRNKQTLTIDEYVNILAKKTASLFEVSATIGATVSGAQESVVKALSDFARLLGVAYQIRDDISDLENAGINISRFIEKQSLKSKSLQETLESLIFEAKQKIRGIKESRAKVLLLEMTDFVASDLHEGV